jgi:hypothetical protein
MLEIFKRVAKTKRTLDHLAFDLVAKDFDDTSHARCPVFLSLAPFAQDEGTLDHDEFVNP